MLGKVELDFYSGIDRIHDKGEFGQVGVALSVHHAPAMLLDFGGNYFSVSGQFFEDGFLVIPHQAGITMHIRAEDRGQLAVGLG